MKERRIIHRLLSFKWRFLLLFSLALVFSIVSLLYFIRFLIKPNTGLVINFPEVVVREGKVFFSPKTPFSPAVAAGLIPHSDQLIGINGRSINGTRDVVEADAGIWSFEPFPVQILRHGVRQTVYITPAMTPSRLDWLFALLFSLALGFTVFYLVLNLPEDTASNFITLAALFYLVFTCLKPFYYESFLTNLLIHLGKLTSWLMVFFGLYFPSPRGRRWLRMGTMAAIGGLYLAFIVLRMYYFKHWSASGEELWLIRYRFLGRLNNISDGLAFIIYGILLVSSYLRTPHKKEKRQIEWILAGFLIAVPPYFFLDQLPIILGEPLGLRISMGNFANLFLMFVPLFFVIGLIKHRVFNIKFFASRYIVYAMLGLIILAFFTVFYHPAQGLFIRNYGLPTRVAGFLVTSLLFFLLVPLRSLFVKLVEMLFYRGHYRKSTRYSASLERKNMELMLIIDELNRQNLRSFQNDKLRELRGIVTGIANRVNNPANDISSSLLSLERKIQILFRKLNTTEPAVMENLAKLEDEINHLIGIAQEGDVTIKDFIKNLVSLAGSRTSIPVSVSAAHLLKNASLEINRNHGDARLRLEVRSRAKLLCDPGELVQAICYLLENAVEAGQNPRQEVSVTADDMNGYLQIQVIDQGLGIDELNLKRVYDPFYTTKAGHEGLGLYFCRSIVERNSGSIEIRSKSGLGTRVRLLLALEPGGATGL